MSGKKTKEEYEKWGLTINLEKTKYVCVGEGKEILKFDGGEERKPCTECTYLGTKIDQLANNTTEIKHRIRQTRKAINALNSIWWHKNVTKNRKLFIYQTVIQSILMYGAEVWQIHTREINKILSTEMDVLRRKKKEARKSRMERMNNEQIKEILGVKGKPDIIDIIEKKRLQWYDHVKSMPEERIPKLIIEWVPLERRKRGRARKTWMEGVQVAMTTRNLEPAQWRSREEWRLVSGRQRQLLTLRRLMSYIYGAPILDVSRSHTTTQHSR